MPLSVQDCLEPGLGVCKTCGPCAGLSIRVGRLGCRSDLEKGASKQREGQPRGADPGPRIACWRDSDSGAPNRAAASDACLARSRRFLKSMLSLWLRATENWAGLVHLNQPALGASAPARPDSGARPLLVSDCVLVQPVPERRSTASTTSRDGTVRIDAVLAGCLLRRCGRRSPASRLGRLALPQDLTRIVGSCSVRLSRIAGSA